MKIDRDFSEEYALADGRVVSLRLVQPEDKQSFVESLNICSHQTLYNRFMGSKPKFSENELRYLTEVDQRHHVAIVGFHDGNLMAVGRAIRYMSQPQIADVGIIIADAYQRNGIGSYLLGLLMIAMIERNVYQLCGEMFSVNNAMFRVVDEVPFDVKWRLDGSVANFEIDLTSN